VSHACPDTLRYVPGYFAMELEFEIAIEKFYGIRLRIIRIDPADFATPDTGYLFAGRFAPPYKVC
jgi:hypothetical protein